MDPAIVKLLAEIWAEYAIGLLFIMGRVFVRTKMVGIRGYDVDDYLILLVALFWTTVAVIAHVFIVVFGGIHTGILSPEQRASLPPSAYPDWESGTQWFLFGLTVYFFVVWTLKLNMLFFYRRVVKGTSTEWLIVPAMGVVVGSFLVIVLTMSLTCRPFHALWQVWPDPGPNCTPQNKVFFITILTFNLFTDTCIIMIPLPVVWGLRTSVWKRAGIYFCFALGIFIMCAAILRYTLIFDLDSAGISASWSIREDFVAIIVGQAPLCVPLFRARFWQSIGYSQSGRTGGRSESHELGSVPNNNSNHKSMSVGGGGGGGKGDKKRAKDPYSITQLGITQLGDNESEENMVQKAQTPPTTSETQEHTTQVDGIVVSRSVNVKHSQGGHGQSAKDMNKSWYYEIS